MIILDSGFSNIYTIEIYFMFTQSVDEVRVDAAQVLGVADPHPGPVHRRVEPRAVAEGGRVAAGVAAARHQREPPHAARHAGVDWARGRGLVLGAEEAAAEPVVAVPHPALLHAVLPAGDQEVVRGAVGVTCLNSALCNVDVDTHINHIQLSTFILL